MSFSRNSGYFFQTTDSLDEIARKKAKKTNKNGSPLQLASKLLDIIADPDDDRFVYIAEAAACVRRVNVEESKIDKTYTGPAAPLTCLALSPSSPRTLFAGCWDKSIWSWNTASSTPGTRFSGAHTDFVKALCSVRVLGTTLLLSAGADASIRIWDAEKGALLHTLKGHTRGVLCLALDPASLTADLSRDQTAPVTVFSGDSAREIRAWRVSAEEASEVVISGAETKVPVLAHETSVDALHFPEPEDGDDEPPDLWTASADKSAKCLSRRATPPWSPDTVLPHPDFVRAVLVDTQQGLVVTACRDEEVRVWDAGSGELVHVYSGHWEEVLGLAFARREGQRGVVSVGIDGTVRWWGLSREDFRKAKEAEGKKDDEVEEVKKEGVLTAEEEAELAELMDDDD